MNKLKLTENLTVGDYTAAQQAKVGDFDLIFCVADDIVVQSPIRTYRCGISDGTSPDYRAVKKAILVLRKELAKNQRVLIHCIGGQFRSVTVACSALTNSAAVVEAVKKVSLRRLSQRLEAHGAVDALSMRLGEGKPWLLKEAIKALQEIENEGLTS